MPTDFYQKRHIQHNQRMPRRLGRQHFRHDLSPDIRMYDSIQLLPLLFV